MNENEDKLVDIKQYYPVVSCIIEVLKKMEKCNFVDYDSKIHDVDIMDSNLSFSYTELENLKVAEIKDAIIVKVDDIKISKSIFIYISTDSRFPSQILENSKNSILMNVSNSSEKIFKFNMCESLAVLFIKRFKISYDNYLFSELIYDIAYVSLVVYFGKNDKKYIDMLIKELRIDFIEQEMKSLIADCTSILDTSINKKIIGESKDDILNLYDKNLLKMIDNHDTVIRYCFNAKYTIKDIVFNYIDSKICNKEIN